MKFEVPYSKDFVDSIKFMNNLTVKDNLSNNLLIYTDTENENVTFQLGYTNKVVGTVGLLYTVHTSFMKTDIEKKKLMVNCDEFYNVIKDVKTDFLFDTALNSATITTCGHYPRVFPIQYSFNAAENVARYNTNVDLDKSHPIIVKGDTFKKAVKQTRGFILGPEVYDGDMPPNPMSFLKLSVNNNNYLEWFSINGYQCGKLIDTSKIVEKTQLPEDGIFIPRLICKSLESWIKPKNDISITYNKDYVIINQISHTGSNIRNSLILSVSREWAEDYPNIDELLNTELDSNVSIWSYRKSILNTLKMLKRRNIKSVRLSTKIMKDEIEAKTYPVLNIRTDDDITNLNFYVINNTHYTEGNDIQDTVVSVNNMLNNIESLGNEVVVINWLESLTPIFFREYNNNDLKEYTYVNVCMPIKEV